MIETRRVGHAGLACALTIVVLLVPHAGRAPADSRGKANSTAVSATSTSARPVDSRSSRAFISYSGVRVTVPQDWPVIDLRVHPQTCDRFRTLEMLRHLHSRHEIHYVAIENPAPSGCRSIRPLWAT